MKKVFSWHFSSILIRLKTPLLRSSKPSHIFKTFFLGLGVSTTSLCGCILVLRNSRCHGNATCHTCIKPLRNPHLRTTTNSEHTTLSYSVMMRLTHMRKDRDPFSRHVLPPFPAGASAVLSFPWELAVITGVFLYPNLQRSRPDSPLLHAHGNIFWRVARHQPGPQAN